jgi:hypothetical protein
VPQVFGYFHEDADAVVGNRVRTSSSTAAAFSTAPASSTTSSPSIHHRRWKRRVRACFIRRSSIDPPGPGWPRPGSCSNGSAHIRRSSRRWPRRCVARFRSCACSEISAAITFASDVRLPVRTAAQLYEGLPKPAQRDLDEWRPNIDPRPSTDLGLDDDEETALFDRVLSQEIPIDRLINAAPRISLVTGDRPMNEYFLLRRIRDRLGARVAR